MSRVPLGQVSGLGEGAGAESRRVQRDPRSPGPARPVRPVRCPRSPSMHPAEQTAEHLPETGGGYLWTINGNRPAFHCCMPIGLR